MCIYLVIYTQYNVNQFLLASHFFVSKLKLPTPTKSLFYVFEHFLVVWNVYGGRKQETLSLGWAMPCHWSACAKLWLSVGTR